MAQEILLFSKYIEKAQEEIVRGGGKVAMRNSSVLVARLPESLDINTLKYSATDPASIGELDSETQQFVDDWKALNEAPERSPTVVEGLRWDTPGYEAP
jgi:hypothetical protein